MGKLEDKLRSESVKYIQIFTAILKFGTPMVSGIPSLVTLTKSCFILFEYFLSVFSQMFNYSAEITFSFHTLIIAHPKRLSCLRTKVKYYSHNLRGLRKNRHMNFIFNDLTIS